jgi:hypothetical protein
VRVSVAPSPASSSTFVEPTEMSKLEPSPPMIRFTTVSFGFRLFVIVQVFASPYASEILPLWSQSPLKTTVQSEPIAAPSPKVSVTGYDPGA